MVKTTEKKIIDAARKVFYAKGYRGATMRDIAKTANVNLALLHYYFRTKRNLFQIVFDETFSFIFFQFKDALDSKGDIFEKIKIAVEGYVSTGRKYPQLYGFIMNEFSVNPTFMDSLLKQFEKRHNVSLHLFDEQVKEAINNNIIKPIETKILLLNILSLCHYPFIGKNFLTSLFFLDKKSFNDMTKHRSEEISNIIINYIKV